MDPDTFCQARLDAESRTVCWDGLAREITGEGKASGNPQRIVLVVVVVIVIETSQVEHEDDDEDDFHSGLAERLQGAEQPAPSDLYPDVLYNLSTPHIPAPPESVARQEAAPRSLILRDEAPQAKPGGPKGR